MVARIEPAALHWGENTLRSTTFDDVYFDDADGLARSRYIFLEHNQLAARFAATGTEGFVVAETGFGTGLNFLATLELWQQQRQDSGWLHYASVEKHPLRPEELARALAPWPTLATQALLEQYPPLVPGFHRLLLPEFNATLTLLFGDATTMLQRLEAQVDAWFLDGFSPEKNPAMWTPELLAEVARLSKASTTLATATAAGTIKQDLQTAGFVMDEAHGDTPEKKMLCGHFLARRNTKSDHKQWLSRSTTQQTRTVAVVGAGIAGCSIAHALALRGWQVDVFEAEDVASGASGNPAAIIYPKLSPPALADEHFQQQAFLFAQRRFQTLADGIWNPCGVLWFLAGNQQREGEKLIGHPWPADLVHQLSAEEASKAAGVTLPCPALHFPTAGWLAPQAFCRALLQHPNIRLHTGCRVAQVARDEHGWQLTLTDGTTASSGNVVIATAYAARTLPATASLPLKGVRGQISQMPASNTSAALKSVLCYGGYLSPAIAGQHCLGASFYPGRTDTTTLPEEHEENRAGLAEYLPSLAAELPATASWTGRAALRCQSPDYLPLVGPLADHEQFCEQFAGLRQGNTKGLQDAELLPGLYCSLGFGSKGFTTALLAAEVLAADINGEPYPVSREMLDALHPHRLWVKQLKRRER